MRASVKRCIVHMYLVNFYHYVLLVVAVVHGYRRRRANVWNQLPPGRADGGKEKVYLLERVCVYFETTRCIYRFRGMCGKMYVRARVKQSLSRRLFFFLLVVLLIEASRSLRRLVHVRARRTQKCEASRTQDIVASGPDIVVCVVPAMLPSTCWCKKMSHKHPSRAPTETTEPHARYSSAATVPKKQV